MIESCLLDWGIEQVLLITVDNASFNDLAIACLKEQFPWRCRVLNNEFLHVRCSEHILNLVVQDGLKSIMSLLSRSKMQFNMLDHLQQDLMLLESVSNM